MMGKRNIQQTKIVFHCVLLAMLTGFAAGCAREAPDPAQLRATETALIQSTVADPARAQKLLALLDERDRLIDETSEMLRQYRREMKAANADYDITRDVIVEMIDYYNLERAREQLRFIDLIKQMKATTTAAEWKVIAAFQLDNFNPRQLVYGRRSGIL